MLGLLTGLIPIISGIAATGSISAALGAITLSEWLGLGVSALSAGDTVVTTLPKVLAALHPDMEALKPTWDKFSADLAAHGHSIAGQNIFNRFSNMPPTIPGYLSDGSLGDIPNPDYHP